MKNKIEEQVKAYIDRPNTDYAVLINGEWGTGKTYFITNVIDWKDLCGTDKKIIYISLNGLSSLEEIKKILVYKYFTSKNKQDTFNTVKDDDLIDDLVDLNASLGYPFAQTVSSLVDFIHKKFDKNKEKQFTKINHDIILILDDLERLSKTIDLAELFGFIHDVLSCKGLKVIFIANEKEIHNEYYNTIKEKYIGHTFRFSPDLIEIISSVQKNPDDTIYNTYIKEHKNKIAAVFDVAEHINIRTFFFFYEIYKTVYNHITTFIENKNTMEIVFDTFLILCIEYKKGNAEQIEKYTQSYKSRYLSENLQNMDNSSKQEKNDNDYYNYIKRTYLNNTTINLRYMNIDNFVNYITEGYYNTDKIKEYIETTYAGVLKDINESEDIRLQLHRFFNYAYLENEELNETIELILKYAEKGLYFEADYLQIYKTFQELLKFNICQNLEIKNIIPRLCTGIYERLKRDTRNTDILPNIVPEKYKDRPFEEYIKHIQEYMQSNNKCIAEKEQIDKIESFITSMNEDNDEDFWVAKQKIDKSDFFCDLSTFNLLSSLSRLNNKGLNRLKDIFNQISNISNAHEAYSAHKEYIDNILNEIKKWNSLETDQLRIYNLINCIEAIEKALEQIGNT